MQWDSPENPKIPNDNSAAQIVKVPDFVVKNARQHDQHVEESKIALGNLEAAGLVPSKEAKQVVNRYDQHAAALNSIAQEFDVRPQDLLKENRPTYETSRLSLPKRSSLGTRILRFLHIR